MSKRLAIFIITIVALLPMAAVRRRAVSPPSCAPTVTLTASQISACYGERVSVVWSASDPTARVSIPGVGTSLPAYGNTIVQMLGIPITFTAVATNNCGLGRPVVFTVGYTRPASGVINGATQLSAGSTSQFTFTVNDATAWTLSSALNNPLNPASGAGTGAFTSTYTASVSGEDTLSLRLDNSCSSPVVVSHFVNVVASSTPPPPTSTQPPPPPSSGNLRCCDGTISPTCTCADKRGCCSSHRGVCDARCP